MELLIGSVFLLMIDGNWSLVTGHWSPMTVVITERIYTVNLAS
jgi:hypothetical protein